MRSRFLSGESQWVEGYKCGTQVKEEVMPPEIDYDKCSGCGRCIDICPVDVFFSTKGFSKTKGEKPDISYPEGCQHCSACVLDCPVEGAILLRTPLAMFIPYK